MEKNMQEETSLSADTEQPTAETVDVIAPSDLMEGFRFNADKGNGRLIQVEVPKGGVKAGERFSAIVVPTSPPVVDHTHVSYTSEGGVDPTPLTATPPGMSMDYQTQDPSKNPHQIPRQNWRDGLCSFTSHCCNPLCLLGCFAYPIAAAQVMTRFRMNLLAQPGKNKGYSTFRIIALLTLLVGTIAQTYYLVGGLFTVYTAFILMQTRAYIREQYQIPATQCGDCEDVCCVIWCAPCTVCQMARHTANYNAHPASCCTATGLPAMAPSIV